VEAVLESGRHTSLSEMAKAEKIDRRYLGKMLRLTLLAPAIVEAILEAWQACSLALSALLECVPNLWEQQWSRMAEPSGSTP
jgi:hypothetical protein